MNVTSNISKYIFRGYDIRGIYGNDLFEDTAYTIGKSYATILKEKYNNDTVIIGHDNRLSSDSLSNALILGILDCGVNVIDLGLVTTSMLYYANELFQNYAGIMVTASHNPKEYNGFKIAFDKKGEICGKEIIEFMEHTLSLDFIDGKGKKENFDIKDKYVEMITSKFDFKNKLKVVVDCGNGTSSIIVKDIFSKLNLDVTYICADSDPEFPNHHPDPAEAENMIMLQEEVKRIGADIGMAFDGDSDRVGVVDDLGNIVPSDYYMAIMSKYILPTIEDKSKKKIIFDVSCSKTLSDEIKKSEGEPYVYKTGNSYIKRKMLEEGLIFGGEISGHTFFYDKFYGFDDGIYAGLRMAEILDENNIKLSKLQSGLIKYKSTPVLKIQVTDDTKAIIVENIKKYCIEKGYNTSTIDGARVEFEDSFVIVRMSNTSPKLTVRFEATTDKRLQELKEEFLNVINENIKKYIK